jgi:hypothetical protein
MVDAYNFIAAWQLFPERGTYELGERPKSAIYRIRIADATHVLSIAMSWTTLQDQGFEFGYEVAPNGEKQSIDYQGLADGVVARFLDAIRFQTEFFKGDTRVLVVTHEITPKGYLQITQKHLHPDREFTNVEVYHKQMSVLPYSAAVSGAVIRPTEEGLIRHHALTAMEEQTNMQLNQIRQQIELLAIQAKEIQQRKELSMMIYNAKISFSPVIGKLYYLYEKKSGDHLLSMVGPKEWGAKIPYKSFVAAVRLLADHTWKEEV